MRSGKTMGGSVSTARPHCIRECQKPRFNVTEPDAEVVNTDKLIV